MKKITLFLLFCSCTGMAFAQNALQNCVRDIFLREDSTIGPGERFTLWQECMSEKKIPSFSVRTLKGAKLSPRKLKGKIVVLNFWFIDCLPCIKELPALNRLVSEYQDNKEVVFLSMTYETKERLEKTFYPKYKLDFEVVPEALKVVELFGKPGYPTLFVIGRDNKIKASWLGGPIDATAETEAYVRAKPVIEKLLKETTK